LLRGFSRIPACRTQGKGKNADEQAFIALPEDTQYLNLDQVMEFGLRSVVRADSKYLTVNRNEDIEYVRRMRSTFRLPQPRAFRTKV
jgi:hypothetical protein